MTQIDVSRETSARLDIYEALLRKWNPAINLVAKSTLAEFWTRHFLDSAEVYSHAPQNTRNWVDLGSGGGFPGLVVAILAMQTQPDLKMTLVESDIRKAVFLRTVIRETDLTAEVISERAETIAPLRANVLSARALAPLSELLSLAEQHLIHDGVALFPKGAKHRQELKEALASWRFNVEEFPSKTGAGSVILKIGDLSRV